MWVGLQEEGGAMGEVVGYSGLPEGQCRQEMFRKQTHVQGGGSLLCALPPGACGGVGGRNRSGISQEVGSTH